MLTPMEFVPGVIYDGRSIILGAAGYMGGWIPAVISALISGGFRLYLGGAGTLPGVLVVAESVLAVYPVALLLIVIIFLNQREYRRVENDLAEGESWYRSLFEDSFAPRLIIEPETGNITDANQAAVDFYGWSRDDLKEMMVFDINVLTPDEVAEKMAAARAQGKTISSSGIGHGTEASGT